MNIKTILGLLTVFLLSCNDNRQNSFAHEKMGNIATVDTIVGSKTITDEIPGSAYRKRAIAYFVIINKDTSEYECIFTESNKGGEVGIDLNIPYLNATMTYRQRLDELKLIIARASSDFNFKSLTSISFGRLILSGDLAIDITKQYQQKFGTGNKLESYSNVEQFLAKSKLGTDLNDLFKPYAISVDKVSIEKLFYTTQKDLYWASKIETDTSNVPDKILDCITWVALKKK